MKTLLTGLCLLALAAGVLCLMLTMGIVFPLLNDVRADVGRAYQSQRTLIVGRTREAIRLLGRGETVRAQEELKRLDEVVEQAWTLSRQQRDLLRERLAEASRAVSTDAKSAALQLENILEQLSARARPQPPPQTPPPPAGEP